MTLSTIKTPHLIAAACLLTAAAFLVAPAMAERKPVPDSKETATDHSFGALRGVQYCEVWLIVGDPESGLGANYYNTSGLNDSADKKDTCPPDMWAEVDAKALEAEYDVAAVFKNGPRGWTMDKIELPAGPVRTIGGIEARWMGKANLPKGVDLHKAGSTGYKPVQSFRKSKLFYEKGQPVFILEDAEGTPWIMQAWSKIVDPSLTYDTLANLGGKLKPAQGWFYRVETLDQDLVISTPEGYNWIVQDELGNTYDACKEGACNFQP